MKNIGTTIFFIAASALLASGCYQGPPSDEPVSSETRAEPLTAEIADEMQMNTDFHGAVRMLEGKGEKVDLASGSIYRHDGAADEFEVKLRVIVDAEGASAAPVAELVYARHADGGATVSLRSSAHRSAPPLEEAFYVPEDTSSSGGGVPACAYFMNADTCHPNASYNTGSFCDGGAILQAAERFERRFYMYGGQKVSYLDTVYSCSPMPAGSGCNSLCN